MSKPFSRRQLLKTGVLAGGSVLAGSQWGQRGKAEPRFGRGPTVYVSQIQDITLRLIGQNVTQINEIADKAKQDLGFTVQMRPMAGADILQTALTQPRSFDVYDSGFSFLSLIVPSGNLQPIEVSRIREFDKILPYFTQGDLGEGYLINDSQGTGSPHRLMYVKDAESMEFTGGDPTDLVAVVPYTYNADTLGYRPDLVDREIESWAELLNPEFQGKTALVDRADIGMMDIAFAAEAAGLIEFENKGNMTREELDRITEIIIEQKKAGQFRAFWKNFDESVNLMASGEVVVQSMWSPGVTAVRAKGIECIYAPLKEGYRGWGIGLGLSRNVSGMELDAAYEYFNWVLDGWVGGFIGRQGYYFSIPENAKQFMSEAEVAYWYDGEPAPEDIVDPFGKTIESAGTVRDGGGFFDRVGNIALWNSIMDEQQYAVQKWAEFIAA